MESSSPPSPLEKPPTRRHLHCEVCRRWVVPLRPHWGWRVAVIATWTVLVGMIFTASKGPGLVALPLVLILGTFVLGPVHAAAGEVPHCPDCGKAIIVKP